MARSDPIAELKPLFFGEAFTLNRFINYLQEYRVSKPAGTAQRY
jgi:hypothetical protein